MNAQVQERKHSGYIGGANAAGILGISPYKTPLQEYQSILALDADDTPDQRAFFARRKALEPFALELLTQRFPGLKIARRNFRWLDPVETFIRAEIDAETVGDENVEIKSVHPLAAKDWGAEGGDDIPVYVTAQAMHGLMVTGRKVCYPVAMIGFDDFRVYRIERDDETIRALRQKEVDFWHDHIEPRIPPAAVNSDDVLRLFTKDNGASVEATAELVESYNALKALKDTIKTAKADADAIEERIKLALGEASALTIDGKPVATWKAQIAHRFDQKAFAAANADLFEQFRKASTTRVFRLK